MSCQSNNRQAKPEYVFKGVVESDSDYKAWRLDRIFDEEYLKRERQSFENGDYDNGTVTAFVPDAETAFKIAKVIIIRRYGFEEYKKEVPFEVRLVDNLVWRIVGRNTEREEGSCPLRFSINRLDGSVVGCYREK
jgi:hypothetical protein